MNRTRWFSVLLVALALTLCPVSLLADEAETTDDSLEAVAVEEEIEPLEDVVPEEEQSEETPSALAQGDDAEEALVDEGETVVDAEDAAEEPAPLGMTQTEELEVHSGSITTSIPDGCYALATRLNSVICVSVPSNSSYYAMELWKGNSRQIFRVTRSKTSATYSFVVTDYNVALSGTDSWAIQESPNQESYSQQWFLVSNSDGTYSLINNLNNRYMGVMDDGYYLTNTLWPRMYRIDSYDSPHGGYTCFYLVPTDVSMWTISIPDVDYTGSARTPVPEVEAGGITIGNTNDYIGTCYTVSYKNNVEAGTATCTIKGVNGFTGSQTVTFKIRGANSGGNVNVYRLYNRVTSEHLYTTNKKEYDSLPFKTRGEWVWEGVAWVAPKKSSTPVYRLYNPRSGDHHYTTSKKERDSLIRNSGWKSEGVAFYSDDTKSVPLYRVYNGRLRRGQHHYTTSKTERNSLVSNSGWRNEGVGFYAVKKGSTVDVCAEFVPYYAGRPGYWVVSSSAYNYKSNQPVTTATRFAIRLNKNGSFTVYNVNADGSVSSGVVRRGYWLPETVTGPESDDLFGAKWRIILFESGSGGRAYRFLLGPIEVNSATLMFVDPSTRKNSDGILFDCYITSEGSAPGSWQN